ncbi:MAG: VPLPA-CTERM sorting domain-containing protein [Paracoccaceae bacterium]
MFSIASLKGYLPATLLSIGLLSAQSSHAAVLDFSSLSTGSNVGASFAIPDAIVSPSEGTLYRYGGVTDKICSISATAFNCEADLEIDFIPDVYDVSVTFGTFNAGDYVDLMVYGAGGALLDTLAIVGNAVVDLSGYGLISSLFFDDSSTGAGYSYEAITYEVAPAVPLPAGLPLLLTGMAAFAGLRRSKRAA